MTPFEILLKLVSYEVCGAELPPDISARLTDENIKEIYEISKAHDLTHLIGSALKKIGPRVSEELLTPFYDEHLLAVFRNRRMRDELSRISDLFESEGIEHIALKGAVLRDFYPESWMRTSCDIDVLVKKEALSSAIELLTDKAEYTLFAKTGHDVSFNSPTGVHLELHFLLIEDSLLENAQQLLLSVWERSVLASGKRFTRLMTDEMFYYYHIVHMAKHFISGGCGIRPFLDHWILKNRASGSPEKRAELIAEGGLSAFEAGAEKLVSVWFGSEEHSDMTRAFERFVLLGGAYGTVENGVSVGVVRRRGKIRYVIARIFPSYRVMKNMYPTLEKKKWLLPFCHVRRWCRIIFRGGTKHARAQFKKSANVSAEEMESISSLLSALELK